MFLKLRRTRTAVRRDFRIVVWQLSDREEGIRYIGRSHLSRQFGRLKFGLEIQFKHALNETT